MKLVEPKEAPVEKPDKDMFDPKNFLAKVGAGKQVLEFHKNQHVFEQGDVAGAVFYIQKGKVKVTVQSEQGKDDEPKFSEMFMAYLLTRNSGIEEDLIDQLFNSSERRLARMLLLLAN